MRRPRDSQRSAVYAWERRLPGWPGPRLSLGGCQDVVRQVWGERLRSAAPLVRDGRGRRHACYVPSCHEIRLPRRSRAHMIVLHETAHAFLREYDGLAWHGPEFARLYLDLLYRYAGVELSGARSLALGPRRVRFGRLADIPGWLDHDEREFVPVADGSERLLF